LIHSNRIFCFLKIKANLDVVVDQNTLSFSSFGFIGDNDDVFSFDFLNLIYKQRPKVSNEIVNKQLANDKNIIVLIEYREVVDEERKYDKYPIKYSRKPIRKRIGPIDELYIVQSTTNKNRIQRFQFE